MHRISSLRLAGFALRLAAFTLFFTALSAPAYAGVSLPTNGGFDSSLAGWDTSAGALWSAQDGDNAIDSGSAWLVASDPDGFEQVSQCLPVTAGVSYTLESQLWIPDGQAPTGGVNIQMLYYDNPTCSGQHLQFDFAFFHAPTGSWKPFGAAGVAPPGATFVRARLLAFSDPGTTFEGYFDDVKLSEGLCADSITSICLAGGRFEVSATWRRSPVSAGFARVRRLTSDSAALWFFQEQNIEMIVKVLDACAPPFDRFWVFAAGLTNVGVTLTVTDKLTGETRTYENPGGTAFQPIQDTQAFDTCP